MGLRQTLGKWRASDEQARERRARRAAETRTHRHQADPATGRLIEDDRRRPRPPAQPGSMPIGHAAAPAVLASAPPAPPAAPPPAPIAGGLIVGSAELRRPDVALPPFYVPSAEPVAPAAPLAEPPNPYDRQLVRQAWDLVSDRADQLVRNFYAELFLALPEEALRMFPASMVSQREDFGRAVVQWVVTDDPDSMTAHLDQLGADHRKFDVEPRHYDIAGQALIGAWSHLAGSRWTPEIEAAVVGSYTRLATIMIEGAMRRRHEPASWGATVIAHERVMGDFAVLRIQPDAPYPYKAGQYLTLEVDSQRRQWRQMSIASAPRPDNTFDIHVRSVAATGVSAALVAHTNPGDRVRLGPPRGNDLVIEPGTVPGGLLCVCSGTGSAPISAVVESIMGWHDCPPLYAFVGGRTTKDMYPVDQLNQLVLAGGKAERVRVYGVVSDDPSYTGYRGRVEQVVPTLLDWAELSVDVLVAGPNTMIETTVVGLTDLGVPLDKIHFDQYEAAV